MSRITHIRLAESYATSTDRITHVKIDTGATETVHPFNGKPYIRTKANYTTSDNLLSLPRF